MIDLPDAVAGLPVEVENTMSEPTVEPVVGTEPETESSGMRVLYVDDNQTNRTLVRAMLATQGIVCETADDGAQGVAAAEAGDWDLILMDIQMPVMDGVTAARGIRALDGQVAATPIIALTANTLDEQVRGYFEAGMNDCIAKPVDMIELLTKVARWGDSDWRQAVGAEAGPVAG